MTDLLSPDWEDYELLDSGGGLKLERFGPYRLIRPDARATWNPAMPRREWDQAVGRFELTTASSGTWRFRRELPPRWAMRYRALRFWAQPTPYRHVGLFPEQAAHWDWFSGLVRAAERPIRVLNLFAYTGLATLAAAESGASVTHVDAAQKAVTWARENAALSELADRPIRWIVDDVLKFVRREQRREQRYDGFIMDPPPFGHGPGGEVWEFNKALPELLAICRDLMTETPLFVVITAYTARTTQAELRDMLAEIVRGGSLTSGRNILEDAHGRHIPTSDFVRWKKVMNL